MQIFTTTRGGEAASLTEAVLRGMAPDGGLYMPAQAPILSLTEAPDVATFPEVARWVWPALFTDLDEAMVVRLVERCFDFPVPVVELGSGRFVLELFHGPTHAFKDFGARAMAALLSDVLAVPEEGPRTILVATSGDTGGAVANAFHGVPGCRVVTLFPRMGISERQRRQMTTLGGNVQAIAVSGTFDDCQRLAKEAFADRDLMVRHGLTSANSINVARLLPQALYYVYAAHALAERGGASIASGTVRPRFVVPSGNLGNLCAGLIAWRSGMPASGFTAAVNANRGFADYLSGASFEARTSVPTVSNAMDVGAPSNLERILWLYGHDDQALRRDVLGVSVDDESTCRCIRRVYDSQGYVLDPHTAVAYEASLRHHARSGEPIVILSTAHPAKFPEVVEAQIGVTVDLPRGLGVSQAGTESMLEASADLDSLREILEDRPR